MLVYIVTDWNNVRRVFDNNEVAEKFAKSNKDYKVVAVELEKDFEEIKDVKYSYFFYKNGGKDGEDYHSSGIDGNEETLLGNGFKFSTAKVVNGEEEHWELTLVGISCGDANYDEISSLLVSRYLYSEIIIPFNRFGRTQGEMRDKIRETLNELFKEGTVGKAVGKINGRES